MPPSTAAGKVAQAREGTAMQEEGPTGPGYLCAQHLDAVFAFVCRRVLSRPEAEDITAEVIGVAAGMPWKLRGDAIAPGCLPSLVTRSPMQLDVGTDSGRCWTSI